MNDFVFYRKRPFHLDGGFLSRRDDTERELEQARHAAELKRVEMKGGGVDFDVVSPAGAPVNDTRRRRYQNFFFKTACSHFLLRSKTLETPGPEVGHPRSRTKKARNGNPFRALGGDTPASRTHQNTSARGLPRRFFKKAPPMKAESHENAYSVCILIRVLP